MAAGQQQGRAHQVRELAAPHDDLPRAPDALPARPRNGLPDAGGLFARADREGAPPGDDGHCGEHCVRAGSVRV